MDTQQIFLWILVVLVFLTIVINLGMYQIERDKCHKQVEKLNLSRCDRLDVVRTLLPFMWSTECYCENFDRIYFNMEENIKKEGDK